MFGFLRKLFSPKPFQSCCIRGCTSRAVYAASVGSSEAVRALCAKESCLNTMKWAEKTERITLTPIGQSILAHAPQAA